MRLSREEFWVLDILAQLNCRLTLATLGRSDANLIFNKRKRLGLSKNDFVDLFVSMQKKGDVILFKRTDGLLSEFGTAKNESLKTPRTREIIDYSPVWQNPVLYSSKEILGDFEDVEYCCKIYQHENAQFRWEVFPFVDHRLYCCATERGAIKWEQTAQVDWNKYLDCEGSWIDDADLAGNQSHMSWRVAAVSQETLDAYFDWKLRWGAHPDSVEWSCFKRYATERISPWRATYWKTFSEGFECDYTELSLHRRGGMNKVESERYSAFFENSWKEHHALFGWCNNYVPDFPFEGD